LPGGDHVASQISGCQAGRGSGSGFTIGKDDGVAMVISLFHPGRVRGLGMGSSLFLLLTARWREEWPRWRHSE